MTYYLHEEDTPGREEHLLHKIILIWIIQVFHSSDHEEFLEDLKEEKGTRLLILSDEHVYEGILH